MRYVCCVLIVGLFTAPAFSQKFSVGVKAGARLTDDLRAGSNRISESKWYTVGPSVQFKFLLNFGLEFDALYKRVGTSYSTYFVGQHYWGSDRSNSWEFPMLARYSFLHRSPTPYISGGYSFRTISGSGTANSSGSYYPTPLTSQYSIRYKNSSGLVVGGGLEINAWFLKISPEFRYTHWYNKALSTYGGQGTFTESTQDQMEILVGFMSRGKRSGKP
jgi:hypothetical protein